MKNIVYALALLSATLSLTGCHPSKENSFACINGSDACNNAACACKESCGCPSTCPCPCNANKN